MKGKYDEESKFTKFARFINSKLNFSKDPHDIACEIARSVLDNSSQKAVELVEISLKSYDYVRYKVK